MQVNVSRVKLLPGGAALIEMETLGVWPGTDATRKWRGEIVDHSYQFPMSGELVFGVGGTRLWIQDDDVVIPVSGISRRTEIPWREDSVPEIPIDAA